MIKEKLKINCSVATKKKNLSNDIKNIRSFIYPSAKTTCENLTSINKF